MEKHLYQIKDKNKTTSACRWDPLPVLQEGLLRERDPDASGRIGCFMKTSRATASDKSQIVEGDRVFKDEKTGQILTPPMKWSQSLNLIWGLLFLIRTKLRGIDNRGR